MSKRRRQRARTAGSSRTQIYLLGALFTAVVAAVIIVVAVTTSGGGDDVPGGPIVVPEARPASVPQNGHVYGDPAAPVTIAEYMDFQCPFCMRAHFQVLPTIEQQYIETGVAKLEIYPIAILGDESVQAASAAECANDQGKFFFYHDTLFSNQGGENVGAFADSRLKEMASVIGLDTGAFDSCLGAGTHRAEVLRDTQSAHDSGVSSTPTFLVNGQEVQTSVDAISAAIEQAAGS